MLVAFYRPLEQALGYEFKNPEFIIEALTHRSYAHENKIDFDNERLEFLGDSVLSICIAQKLVEYFPEHSEGKLSKLRALLVSESNLSAVARDMSLGFLLRLGKGELRSGGGERDSVLANALEAVLAAIFLDGGFGVARRVIVRIFGLRSLKSGQVDLFAGRASLVDRDYKSQLQELCQSRGWGTPRYFCTSMTGLDHAKVFTMTLQVLGREVCSAQGGTKKLASQKAALRALEYFQKGGEFEDSLLTIRSEVRP